jgi:hypothetical protein
MSKLVKRSNQTILREYGTTRADLEIEVHDLIIKVQELLTTHDLYEPDGTYTFEDGERWAKFNPEQEDSDE